MTSNLLKKQGFLMFESSFSDKSAASPICSFTVNDCKRAFVGDEKNTIFCLKIF
jgi:hypothetical protein